MFSPHRGPRRRLGPFVFNTYILCSGRLGLGLLRLALYCCARCWSGFETGKGAQDYLGAEALFLYLNQ